MFATVMLSPAVDVAVACDAASGCLFRQAISALHQPQEGAFGLSQSAGLGQVIQKRGGGGRIICQIDDGGMDVAFARDRG